MKKPGRHFSALFLIDQDLQRDPERRMRAVPQEALEKILVARARELGIEIRRGVALNAIPSLLAFSKIPARKSLCCAPTR